MKQIRESLSESEGRGDIACPEAKSPQHGGGETPQGTGSQRETSKTFILIIIDNYFNSFNHKTKVLANRQKSAAVKNNKMIWSAASPSLEVRSSLNMSVLSCKCGRLTRE